MKKLLIMAAIGLRTASAQDLPYVIRGEMPVEGAQLTLQYNKGNRNYVKEQAVVKGGRFEFKGTVDAPYKVSLSRGEDMLEFYLDSGTTMIRTPDSLKHAVVSGTQLVRDGQGYDAPMNDLFAEWSAAYEKKGAAADSIDELFLARQKALNLGFVRDHPASRLNLYIFREQSYGIEYAELAPLFAGIAPQVRESTAGRAYAARLQRLKAVAIGQIAPAFTHPDTSGKMVSLSSFRGRYVLIDFWASWCGPCRGESPYLVAAHDRYKDRKFTIIGISLDKQSARKQWLQAIRQDKLFWTQLSDLSDVNPVVQLYGVKGIPQNFLLDPEGKIIAHNLRGEMLERKLNEVIK